MMIGLDWYNNFVIASLSILITSSCKQMENTKRTEMGFCTSSGGYWKLLLLAAQLYLVHEEHMARAGGQEASLY